MRMWTSLSLYMTLVVSLLIGTAGSPQIERTQANHSQAQSRRHAPGDHLSARGIPNFGRVTPTLYRGGQPSSDGFHHLAELGVKIVVDTGRSRRDERLVKKLGMTYVPLPWYCPFPKDEVFVRFLKLVRQNPGKTTFVHCRLGDDRTGLMIASYRIAQEGWTAKEAMQEMQEFGFRGPHHLICPSLARYEKSLPQRLQSDPAFASLR